MKTIRLSVKDARELLEFTEGAASELPFAPAWLLRLRSALRPSPKRREATRKRKAAKAKKWATKREQTAAIYAEVEKRAGGKCEACGEPFRAFHPPHMDHFVPRRHGQSVESCWLIHGIPCHLLKHAGDPLLRYQFIAHCDRHGYTAEAARARRELEAEELTRQAAEASGAGRPEPKGAGDAV